MQTEVDKDSNGSSTKSTQRFVFLWNLSYEHFVSSMTHFVDKQSSVLIVSCRFRWRRLHILPTTWSCKLRNPWTASQTRLVNQSTTCLRRNRRSTSSTLAAEMHCLAGMGLMRENTMWTPRMSRQTTRKIRRASSNTSFYTTSPTFPACRVCWCHSG